MPIACKICVARYGLRGSEIGDLPKTQEELAEHLENEHGMVVIREGETRQQADARCTAKGIVPDQTKCQCADCRKLRGQ